MSAREQLSKGVRVSATALCHREPTLEGGLRAIWRSGVHVTGGANAVGQTSEPAMPVVRRRSPRRWVSAAFIGALYLVIVLTGIALVTRIDAA